MKISSADVVRAIRDQYGFDRLPPRKITAHSGDVRATSINDAFVDKRIEQIGADILDEYAGWLHLFTPSARQYYMPAFLLRAVDDPTCTQRFPWILFALDPPPNVLRFKAEFDSMTVKQRQIVAFSLRYLHQELPRHSEYLYVIDDALARFWDVDDSRSCHRNLQPKADRIAACIREAFGDVVYPGDEAIGYDLQNPDGLDVNYDFRGYCFDEVPRQVLAYHHYNLSFFSPRGRQYYLAAYLLAALDHDICGTRAPTVYELEQDGGSRLESHYGFYTSAQKSAIRQFLEYICDELVDEDDLRTHARAALVSHWGTF